jgi:hypothetical protein
MARSRDELLEEFCRDGARSYEDAKGLLIAWGFIERMTSKGHSLWIHHSRRSSLTIVMTSKLKPCYKQLIKKKIQELLLED